MNAERIAGIAVFAVVVVAITIGFTTIGPPQHMRLVELDQRRVYDLRDIESRLHLESNQRPSDPESALPQRPVDNWPRDPLTGKPYEYHRESAARYQVCATFALASEADADDSPWRHGAGRTCYRLSSVGPGRPARMFTSVTTQTVPR